MYDITSFLLDHPGGGDLILKYGGTDVSEIMVDELSHAHSAAAYEILFENVIGFVANEATIKVPSGRDRPKDIVPMLPNVPGLEGMEAHNFAENPDQSRSIFMPTGLFGFKTHEFWI